MSKVRADADDRPGRDAGGAGRRRQGRTDGLQARGANFALGQTGDGPAPGLPAPAQPQAQARFAVSPKMLLLIGTCIAIPTVIWIVKAGPVKARDQWQVIEPRAQDDIKDVINKALADDADKAVQSLFASLGRVPGSTTLPAAKAKYSPSVGTVLIDSPTIMWSVPSKVPFQGRIGESIAAGFSAAGKPQLMNVHGLYYPKTRGVEADVQIEGRQLKVRGRIVAGAVVMD
ncbi:MAG: hypothetical protein ACHRHE_02350 [Tepidisphaerales bacterium]